MTVARQIIATVLGNGAALDRLIEAGLDQVAEDPAVFSGPDADAIRYIAQWWKKAHISPGRAAFELHFDPRFYPLPEQPAPIEELLALVRQAADVQVRSGPTEVRTAGEDNRHPNDAGNRPRAARGPARDRPGPACAHRPRERRGRGRGGPVRT